jgi:hypothetical protein
MTPRGTMGQQVPANLDTTTLGMFPIYAAALRVAGSRLNLGLTEVSGGSGVVRVGDRDYTIAPFSHVQFATEQPFAKISVISGDARVVAYLSQVDNASGDAMFIPAMHVRVQRAVAAPALSAVGANGVPWHTDLWMVVPEPTLPFIADFFYLTGADRIALPRLDEVQLDVVANGFGRPNTVGAIATSLPPGLLAFTRIATDGMSQFVPFVDTYAPAEQHLVFIESGGGYRTNIGIVADVPAVAEVIVVDSGGAEIERRTLSTERGVAQTPVLARVIGGRAIVRFLSGYGHAYASLIDNGTADATFVQ